MIAFDTDVLVEIFAGNSKYIALASAYPPAHQSVPVVVVEEMLRARLNSIRQAEAGKAKIDLPRAYELFAANVRQFQDLVILPYTPQADDAFQQWRKAKVRVRTHDLRIASICVAHSATLVTRNRHDFEQVPNLAVEFWG